MLFVIDSVQLIERVT